MTRATITNWPRGRSFGFAQTDEGLCVFVHAANLSDDVERAGKFTLRNRRIEFDMIKSRDGASTEWAAINVRLLEDERPVIAPPVAPTIAPHVTPAPKEIPRDIAIALGLIDEPKPGKRMKRDRIGA